MLIAFFYAIPPLFAPCPIQERNFFFYTIVAYF